MRDIKHVPTSTITDIKSGLSRQFAFAQFATVPDAKSFYDSNPASIQFKGRYGNDQGGDQNPYVTIAYSREKEERPLPGQGDNDWMCEVVRRHVLRGPVT